MANGKKSFIAYTDWKDTFDALPDDKAGLLIKFIFAYVNDENPETDDILIKAVFAGIKHTLKRDLKKYDAYIEKQRVNGAKGGRPKRTQKTQALNKKPKKADSVSDSVSDSVINKKENRFVFRKELINLGFEKDLVDDWLKVRKNKKATNSETVLKSIEKQIANTNIDKNDILRMHVLKSWAGFKVVWYINETTKSNTVTKPRFQNDRL